MRRLISICLALLLFLPGQVCASVLCLHGGAAMPCHHAHRHGTPPMLQQDCAQSDLQIATSFSVEKPATYAFVFSPPAAMFMTPMAPAPDIFPARGPPDAARLKPPLLLLTSRFRP